jgi:hypothetical protein
LSRRSLNEFHRVDRPTVLGASVGIADDFEHDLVPRLGERRLADNGAMQTSMYGSGTSCGHGVFAHELVKIAAPAR